MLKCGYFSTSGIASSYDELEQRVDHFIEVISKIWGWEEVIKLSSPQDTEQVPN